MVVVVVMLLVMAYLDSVASRRPGESTPLLADGLAGIAILQSGYLSNWKAVVASAEVCKYASGTAATSHRVNCWQTAETSATRAFATCHFR